MSFSVIFVWPSDSTFLTDPGNMLRSYFTTTQPLSDNMFSSHDWKASGLNLSSDAHSAKFSSLSLTKFSVSLSGCSFFSIRRCFSGIVFRVSLFLDCVTFFCYDTGQNSVLISESTFLNVSEKRFVSLLSFVVAISEFHICWTGRLRLYKNLTLDHILWLCFLLFHHVKNLKNVFGLFL